MSPDAALLLLTASTLLIYVELNRPGLILAGATGLTICLLAAARLIQQGSLSTANLVLCLLGLATLALSTRTRARKHLFLGLLATTLLFFGFRGTSSTRPHRSVTIACALFVGIGTSFLTTIAARARQNKGLDLK